MGYPTRLLADGEQIRFQMRPHWRSMVIPSLVLLVTVAAAVFLVSALDGEGVQGWVRWAVLAVAVVVLVGWFVRPLLRWLTTQYVFTDRRIITRTGIVARQGMDMPLAKVNDVQFAYTVLERVLRCGTLDISSASEDGSLVVRNIPRVEEVQREIYQLVEADQLRRRRLLDSSE